VALAGNVGDVPFLAVAVAQRLAETGHVNPEVARVDDQIAPHARNQLAVSDELARAFDQYHQNVEGTVAQCQRDAVLLECAGCGEEAEWPKGDGDALRARPRAGPEGRQWALAEHRTVALTVNLALGHGNALAPACLQPKVTKSEDTPASRRSASGAVRCVQSTRSTLRAFTRLNSARARYRERVVVARKSSLLPSCTGLREDPMYRARQ